MRNSVPIFFFFLYLNLNLLDRDTLEILVIDP